MFPDLVFYNYIPEEGFLRFYNPVVYLKKPKPSENTAYINPDREPIILYSDVTLIDDKNTLIPYDYTQLYLGVKYYTSAEDTDGIVINNDHDSGVFIDRSLDSSVLSVYNNTGDPITVQRIEYTTIPSNYILSYLDGISHEESVDLPNGSYKILTDFSGNDILYDNNLKYSGVRIFNDSVDGHSLLIDNSTKDFYLGKILNPDTGELVVAIFNNSTKSVQINSVLFYTQDVPPVPPKPPIEPSIYRTIEFDVISQIQQKGYKTKLFNVIDPIESEGYKTVEFSATELIESEEYRTILFNVIDPIESTSYKTIEFSATDPIESEEYKTVEFDCVETIPISGLVTDTSDHPWGITEFFSLLEKDE